ncbi:hypothetical protein GCM10018785_08770 [Streptomyces longispororuber]|uniref:Uncharacterized protein n=1 Tax=Streptomyces longispororuber TaxID=68230 RepID=A0A918Z9L7_9ACTN|nr:hypothetical protein GCM10018785_08770 [Streptomyces longispororuber]
MLAGSRPPWEHFAEAGRRPGRRPPNTHAGTRGGGYRDPDGAPREGRGERRAQPPRTRGDPEEGGGGGEAPSPRPWRTAATSSTHLARTGGASAAAGPERRRPRA